MYTTENIALVAIIIIVFKQDDYIQESLKCFQAAKPLKFVSYTYTISKYTFIIRLVL